MSGIDELVRVATTVGLEAGELIWRARQGHVTVANTKSTDVDVVTEVDRQSEALIQKRLAELRPGDGFLGEEGGAEPSTTGVTWVVDPIDGTVNFLYGIPEYTVSIAAVEGPPDPENWTLLAGAVVNPSTGEVFSAGRGLGAHHGTKKMSLRQPVELSQALLLTGFAYSPHFRQSQAETLLRIITRLRDIRRIGTASLDLAMVANGQADIYFERTLSPWDFAAGALMVMEAGGVVTGWGDRAPGREAIFAGHPEMVARMRDLIHEVGGLVALEDIPENP